MQGLHGAQVGLTMGILCRVYVGHGYVALTWGTVRDYNGHIMQGTRGAYEQTTACWAYVAHDYIGLTWGIVCRVYEGNMQDLPGAQVQLVNYVGYKWSIYYVGFRWCIGRAYNGEIMYRHDYVGLTWGIGRAYNGHIMQGIREACVEDCLQGIIGASLCRTYMGHMRGFTMGILYRVHVGYMQTLPWAQVGFIMVI